MTTVKCTLGVDVGTSSSKGVLVDGDGQVIATATVTHEVSRPRDGWVEMDGELWWREFVTLARELVHGAESDGIIVDVGAVGVSGMGPCILLADEADVPVRPAILYGVDTRAASQITRMTDELGGDEIVAVGGSVLTSQAGGPKVRWVADEEPEVYARARRLFMPASWLVRHLTGVYVLDHQSASQMSPLYEVMHERWHRAWWAKFASGLEAPQLLWPGEIAGVVTPAAAADTGLAVGTPVIAGTIDAWTEAVSAGAHGDGDLMLMYGTTMFLIATGAQTLRTPSMWTTVGAFPGSRNLAGGLATSGALTTWLKDLTQADYATLLADAGSSPPGAHGLVVLPYFAGERTPILDPDARGVVAGLTLRHGRGDLYRAALEATAFGVRHNIDTLRAAGADIRRIVAVGGGTQGGLWLQIVSDVTGLEQQVPRVTIGASFGAAFLAARAVAPPGDEPRIDRWNPVATTVRPNVETADRYRHLYSLYLELYERTIPVTHALADLQRLEGIRA